MIYAYIIYKVCKRYAWERFEKFVTKTKVKTEIKPQTQVKTGNLNVIEINDDVKNEVVKGELEIIDNVNDRFKLYPNIPYPNAPTFADLITRNKRECTSVGQQSEWVCECDEKKELIYFAKYLEISSCQKKEWEECKVLSCWWHYEY